MIIKSIFHSVLLVLVFFFAATALHASEPSAAVNEAAAKLVAYCAEQKGVIDERALTALVEYVAAPKQDKNFPLPKQLDSTGAYSEFDVRTPFLRFMEYSYSPYVPPVITRPSSLRYSLWSAGRADNQRLPAVWKPVPPGGAPVVINGMQRESDTPDLNTGVYHEYELKRTLILFNYKGRQALVSVSKQVNRSDVGKKGFILGSDSSWNYYYTGEPGTPRTGLGWIKSYIYDYFSIGVFLDSGSAAPMVRTGVFQWLRAGWSGMNFVKASHIIAGMKRFSRDCKSTLESPHIPSPGQITSVYQWLSNMAPEELKGKYAALQHGQRAAAVHAGHIAKPDEEEQVSFAHIPKEQMLQELMLDYLKISLGRPAILGKQAFSPAQVSAREPREVQSVQ